MKTRSKCKVCGASGVIRIPVRGHYSWSTETPWGTRMPHTTNGPTTMAYTKCHPDKYQPKEQTKPKVKRKDLVALAG